MDHDRIRKFHPRTLRLSNSFSSLGAPQRRRQNLITIQRWKRGFETGDMNPLHSNCSNVSLMRKSRPGHCDDKARFSISTDYAKLSRHSHSRNRTQSLDRKLGEGPRGFRKMSIESHSAQSSRRPSVEDENPRKLFQMPIERTVLSVLPHKRVPSDSSIEDNQSIAHASEDSQQCSSFANTSGGSAQSTLGTSVDLSPNNNRSSYQPRPLLLASFGAQNRVNSKGPSRTLSSQLAYSVGGSKGSRINFQGRNRANESKIEQDRQASQQKLSNKEAKQMLKKEKEKELTAISNHINGKKAMDNIEEADEDDCWSWLSGSDAEEDIEEGVEEEMAVVWRASLDVGRRVSKDRRALGKGHGIHVPKKQIQQSIESTPDHAPKSNYPSVKAFPGSGWLSSRLNSFLSYPIVRLLIFFKRAIIRNLQAQTSGAFILGSGFIGGVFASMAYSALSQQLPSLITSGYLPKSSGLGLILHLTFPQRSAPIASLGPGSFSSMGYLHGGLGLGSSWC
ncbi:expressed protein [Phakopsora pachyrhizi]|uniref:Expressed protein n=1 Tax=Phakopsora pachyrhizi TaxID=170000 RepID=A0AAV0AXV8_PHAPC|nr:expressed protein [Phakopsora pachyrhizi]